MLQKTEWSLTNCSADKFPVQSILNFFKFVNPCLYL